MIKKMNEPIKYDSKGPPITLKNKRQNTSNKNKNWERKNLRKRQKTQVIYGWELLFSLKMVPALTPPFIVKFNSLQKKSSSQWPPLGACY